MASDAKSKKPTKAAIKTKEAKVAKAKNTAKVVKKGAITKVSKKIRTSVHFHRPKTLELPKHPKYARRSANRMNKLDQYQIIRFPLTTESAMKKIEDDNTLVFITDLRANKIQIKKAVKALYDINAVKVNTLIRPDGQKKAYVRLAADHDAVEVANTIGII